MSLYINGVLMAQNRAPFKPIGALDPTEEPAIGIGNSGGALYHFPFDGMIDELALYSRALSPNEIRAIYDAGSAGKEGLISVLSLQPEKQRMDARDACGGCGKQLRVSSLRAISCNGPPGP